MKFNWGKSIVLAFGLFMVFILYFVFKVQSNDDFDHELVTDDYYKKELIVQEDIDKKANANALTHKLEFIKDSNALKIQFPSDFDFSKIKGKVYFYRPSSQKLDFEIPISLSNSYLLIPKTRLTGGLWEITVDWSYESTEYMNKETVYY